jgi:hypothetical protein
MGKKYEMILSAEESFAREVALGVQVTRPFTVWHYMIPGIFIIDFLRRGSAVRRYSFHFMFPRRLALDVAQDVTLGEDRGRRLLRAREETETWLHSLNLYSEGLTRSQTAMVRLLVDHYDRLLKADGDSYYALIEKAYATREGYEAFLSRLASAEEKVDQGIIEALGETEGLRERLIAERTQVDRQREKHLDKIFSWIG